MYYTSYDDILRKNCENNFTGVSIVRFCFIEVSYYRRLNIEYLYLIIKPTFGVCHLYVIHTINNFTDNSQLYI